MTLLGRYMLRLFVTTKYVTASVVDRTDRRLVAESSTVERALNKSIGCGRTSNTKAAVVVGEVLAMRLKVEGLERGGEGGIHVDINKEVRKNGCGHSAKIWAVVNSLKGFGVRVIVNDEGGPFQPGLMRLPYTPPFQKNLN